jgi:hypothetical protein
MVISKKAVLPVMHVLRKAGKLFSPKNVFMSLGLKRRIFYISKLTKSGIKIHFYETIGLRCGMFMLSQRIIVDGVVEGAARGRIYGGI